MDVWCCCTLLLTYSSWHTHPGVVPQASILAQASMFASNLTLEVVGLLLMGGTSTALLIGAVLAEQLPAY